MREQAGISLVEAARRLGVDRTMLSNVEAGRTGISEDRVRWFAHHYECHEPALIEALAKMAVGRKARHWWEEYRGKIPEGFLDVSEVEHHAHRLRTAQTVHLPGLFQTEDHARALFNLVVPPLSRLEIELRVAHRMARRQVIEREDPVPYVGIIHEAALRMEFGGRAVARSQLRGLVEATEREHVTLLVIPFRAGSFHGAGQSILYAEGPVRALDTVQLDTAHGSYFADAPTPLANYRSLLDLMEASALPQEESRDFIHAIVRDL
ncbi:helix-turn-helix transcriptional regulator [Streptomyces sp. ST2-7A]|nr:helix-turn-helix transcriptional regulator [Streptomyces sp. ST2-7A]